MARSSASAHPLPDHYARLGVAPDASQAEIRQAFRQLAKQTHPDRNPDDPEAASRFQRIQAAHAVLSDPARRARYDARRTGRAAPGTSPAPDHVTASSIDDAGCLAYYLPRVAVGVLACIAFLVLELLDVWSTDDPWDLTFWIAGASAATGGLSVLLFRAFPDESLDYAVRFRRKDVTLWMEGAQVVQFPWQAVRRVEAGAPNVWTLVVSLPALPAVRAHPPVLAVERLPSLGLVRLRFDLRATDVPTVAMQRFVQAYGPQDAA